MKINAKNNEIEKMYFFGGNKFGEYIEMKDFREQIVKELGIKEEEISSLPLGDIFSKFYMEKPNFKNRLDKIFFDNILYSHLKHVYINKFDSNQSIPQFKENMKKMIEKLNFNDNIPSALRPAMSEDGFFLMDRLNITSIKSKFIAGFDYETDGVKVIRARILFVEVVPINDRTEYFLAGIDIDFNKNTYLIMIKNKQNIKKLDNESENAQLDRTVYRLYNRVKNIISTNLNFNTLTIDVKKDREGMYALCKGLDEELLKDIRAEVKSRTSSSLLLSVKTLMNDLFPTGKKPKKNDRVKLEENISSMLIATYIKTNYKASELVKLAKIKNLVGYPTKIKFTSNRANKGSTESSGSRQPVSASDMFHSLYISFRDALGLEQWSISWFTDYKFLDKTNDDVIQTTIYSKSTYFEIVFKASRALDKEIIYHVIEYLNKHRY